jgi:hypothetical protein
MTLYNLRSDGDGYRITKFDNDLNVESSYLLSEHACECPAGHRSSCRHRQMLPHMLAAGLADSAGFYDFETRQVLVPISDDPMEEDIPSTEPEAAAYSGDSNGSLPGLSQQIHTTIAYMADGSVQITEHDKPHPTIGPIKRRI